MENSTDKILQISDEDLSNNILENSKCQYSISCHRSNQRFKILTFCCNQYIDNNNNRLNKIILQFGFGFLENWSLLEIDQVIFILINTILTTYIDMN